MALIQGGETVGILSPEAGRDGRLGGIGVFEARRKGRKRRAVTRMALSEQFTGLGQQIFAKWDDLNRHRISSP
jgi:hypothetical protein